MQHNAIANDIQINPQSMDFLFLYHEL